MEEELKKRTPSAVSEPDWENWDNWNEDLEKALPNWDQWNNDLKELLPDADTAPQSAPDESPKDTAPDKGSEPETGTPDHFRKVESRHIADSRDGKVAELHKKPDVPAPDKQLLFFIQKYKSADRICKEAGISLRSLQHKVGYLSYKLKRYIEIDNLYRETSPVKLTDEGIHISKGHLIDTGFESGDRFRVDFKEKYIVLSKLQKPTDA